MKKFYRTILKVIPIILIGAILFTSSFIFEINKEQTYERVRNLKETQVQVIASQVDAIVKMTDQPFSADKENIYGLQKMIENVNEQNGVYCYLFDKDCNQITSFSKQQKHVTGEKIAQTLKNNELNVAFTHEYHGYVTIKIDSNEDFLVYWQGIPSGNRNNCEYFIILTISKNEVQENEAIQACKIMIGILTIGLGISLYGNLYIKPVLQEKKEEKESE